MPFNAPKRSNLQSQLIESLEILVANKNDFDKKFIHILKSTSAKDPSQGIPPRDYDLLCSHVYKTIQTAITALKNKDILDDDYKKVFSVIFTLIEAHPWITALPERNEKLRELANECLQRMTLNVEITHKTKSRK